MAGTASFGVPRASDGHWPVGFESRWSFGLDSWPQSAPGQLVPEMVISGSWEAVLSTRVASAGDDVAVTGPGYGSRVHTRAAGAPARRLAGDRHALARAAAASWASGVAICDDKGGTYTARTQWLTARRESAGLATARFDLHPAPGRTVRWIELRGPGEAAARLWRSPLAEVRLGGPAPVAVSADERELAGRAEHLVGMRLRHPADSESRLPGQVASLCAALAEHQESGGLPSGWSGMLAAAHLADGPRRHVDIGVGIPLPDGVAVLVDCLFSWPRSWWLWLRAVPGWWGRSEDGNRKWAVVSVHARDDLGNSYLSSLAGSTGLAGHDEVALEFRPRLDPRATSLTLSFRGTTQEVRLEVR